MGPLVIDANILFSAALRDGATRRLILHGRLDLHAPAWLWDELAAHRAELVRRSGATAEAFDVLVAMLRQAIRSVPPAMTLAFLPEAHRRIGRIDADDVVYIATALAISAGLWTHDKRLGQRAGLTIVTTEGLLQQGS